MIVMPGNNSNAHKLEKQYPGRMGLLIGPSGWRDSRSLPYALDNGAYPAYLKGKWFDGMAFKELLGKAERSGSPPLWVVVPDVVGDADGTFRSWDEWTPLLGLGQFKLALAVQDGMTPESVRRNTDPDVIFVGGTTEWKRRTIWNWCQNFPRVHVGRVNTEKWLWNAHRCGAESCDGNGWFRGDKSQLAGLHRYLNLSSQGLSPRQLELAFADTYYRD